MNRALLQIGILGVAALLLFLAAGPAFGSKARTNIVGVDDWPADAFIDPGTLTCAGGELVWANPVTPVCPGSGRLRMRGAVGYGCTQAQEVSGGAPEPRVSGVVGFEVNGNLDAEYSGSVWGTWRIVPGDCQASRLFDPETPHWSGNWVGQRLRFCQEAGCRWIGEIKLVGKGHGGLLEGLHFRGSETITTFTPLPVPWELIGLCPPCGPEGVFRGTIKD